MRRFTLDTTMMAIVVMTLLAHYLVNYTAQKQVPKKEYLWRAIVCVTEHSTSPRLTAVWWVQAGLREADVVQIPVQALIGYQTAEKTPTLASLYQTPHFVNYLRRFTRYALGLPAPKVIECPLEALLGHTVGQAPVSFFIPENTMLVLDHKSVFYGRGTHRLSISELRELWSGYSFWGGEWGRLQRQRLILQTIVHLTASNEELPEPLLWLAYLRYSQVHYFTVPGSRGNSWMGPHDDVIRISPASFQATARRLREKDKRSDVRVRLCFSPKVPLATQQQITEEIFDMGFSVYVDDGSSGCRTGSIRAIENLPGDVKQLQAVVQRHAQWGGYCQQGAEVLIMVQ